MQGLNQGSNKMRLFIPMPEGKGFQAANLGKVKVKNEQILAALRAHYLGEWRKVYRRGRDGTEIHYFGHRRTGKVWGVKVK